MEKINLLSDNPIDRIENDIVYQDFVNSIFNDIVNLQWKNTPFVIAINWEWGSWKTSIMKLLKNKIDSDKIVDLNW